MEEHCRRGGPADCISSLSAAYGGSGADTFFPTASFAASRISIIVQKWGRQQENFNYLILRAIEPQNPYSTCKFCPESWALPIFRDDLKTAFEERVGGGGGLDLLGWRFRLPVL